MSRSDPERVLVLNPVSGSEDHVAHVETLAHEHGFEVRKSEGEGDARQLARAASNEGADLVATAGGDGTVNEVVDGVLATDGLAETTVAVVPAGTGNNFASNVGVESIAEAFDVIEDGERRRIDLGIANGRAFVNSCIGGVTAEASAATTPNGKREYGVLAYVLRTLETISSFDSLPLRVTLEGLDGSSDAERWEGEALFVLVGNCRRFAGVRRTQADVEDGLFEVTIVEEAPPTDLVGQAALERLFDRETTRIVTRRASRVTLESLHDEPVEYSLDGESLEAERLTLETSAERLEVAVGDRYQPDPDASGW
ncbi:diacylglycerol/lipid kinase family protein [Natribaculum luteum]|uniref:Diacylglycerol/lipid kinase family protein n=1 Tax=Natribaculum luteum TaxID=1586232 RepID=A0ABD5P375_9EURY|nr:diacylglycerol kinase family protein [Natribaculum luteum]